MQYSAIPDIVPILSAGRHRNPRRGACFMEFASYLAGERWSDHPACTHPSLAALARDVNDLAGDEMRQRLVPLIHRVVGLNGTSPLISTTIALRAATHAIPIASMERQRALAAGILTVLPEVASVALVAAAREALDTTPDAERWARGFLASMGTPSQHGRRRDESILHTAVAGIAFACVPDPQSRLVELLEAAIDDVETLLGVPRPAVSRKSDPAFENA